VVIVLYLRIVGVFCICCLVGCRWTGGEVGNHSEDRGIHGTIVSFKMVLTEGVDWIHLAHDRDRWRALVNTIMNLLVP
jgi:hypothetical protein